MLWELTVLFVTAFVVGLTGAMMPGPMLTLTISEAGKRGASAGPLIILGHAVLEAVLVICLIMGPRKVSQSSVSNICHQHRRRNNVVTDGSWYISGLAGDFSLEGHDDKKKGLHPVLGGIIVSLSNPYWTIWWATIGLAYLTASVRTGIAGVIIFFAGHIMADFVWYGIVSLGVAKGRNIIPDRVYKGVLKSCAAAMLVFGILFLCAGISGTP